MRSCAFPNALLAIQTTIWRLVVLHPKTIRSLSQNLHPEDSWMGAAESDRTDFVYTCLENLERAEPRARREYAELLLYISQGLLPRISRALNLLPSLPGVAAENTDSQDQLHMAQANNILLFECGAFPIFLQCLQAARTCGAARTN